MSLGNSLPDVSRANYQFDGWYIMPDNTTKFESITTVTANITVKAKWTFTGYNLTFDGDGAFDNPTPAINNVKGTGGDPTQATAQLPDKKPKKTDYLFDGWYTEKNGGGSEVTTATPVSANTIYYAKWVTVPAGWTYISETGGMTKTFNYLSNGDHIQSFTVLVEGSYTFELLGAAGGKGYNTTSPAMGGAGGKSKGTITNLPKTTILHVYVGGKGVDGGATSWNGGGNSGGFVYGLADTPGNQSDSTTKIQNAYTSYTFTNGSSTQGEGSSGDGSATVTYKPWSQA
jgi:uncharacterized repeat protein (TIGR02543 family)